MRKSLLTSCLILCTTSCINYNPKPVKIPDITSWKYETTEEKTNAVACPEKWWHVFGDATLNELEEEALRQSPTLQMAIARLKEAKAQLLLSESDQYPHLDLFTSSQRQP